jgi:hypothetical protein
MRDVLPAQAILSLSLITLLQRIASVLRSGLDRPGPASSIEDGQEVFAVAPAGGDPAPSFERFPVVVLLGSGEGLGAGKRAPARTGRPLSNVRSAVDHRSRLGTGRCPTRADGHRHRF